MNDPTWPKSELVRDFMRLQYTCKFVGVIKTEGAMPRTMSNMFFFYHSRTSNSKNCTIWLKFKLVRDFMLLLVILIQISIENKVAMPGTTFPPL